MCIRDRTFCCELCRNGWTDRFAIWVVDSGGLKESHRRAHWCHLANTVEPSICGSSAALCQNVKLLWPLVNCYVSKPTDSLLVTNIDLIRPILINWQTLSVTHWPLIVYKGILLQHLSFCVVANAYSHTVGLLVWSLCISLSVNNANITAQEFFQQLFWMAESCMLASLSSSAWQFF